MTAYLCGNFNLNKMKEFAVNMVKKYIDIEKISKTIWRK